MPEGKDGTAERMPQGYIDQLIAEWQKAHEALVVAAHEGREAQSRWASAVSRELDAHRRMREAIEANGK